ncbi:MAG TPA: acyltransferase family protein [Solirubrobacteraceae bacterium]|jgi:peptidoglycan/LPS O-acetylase OafA/YrhL|nr:acyltransferase family protein [Solirubrobacteraceae bacterium]
MSAPTKTSHDAYRPQLDGIRAVAVILVILFHLGYGWMTGGFIGVDVFFVLSGYLITGLLVDELTRSGRVDLAHFYARRVRRLLPAAVLVVAVVLVAAVGLLDRVDQASAGGDATFSALYSVNWRFAFAGGDYFAPGDVPSPLIHFWSLAVEEQFYVVWPALLLGLWALGKRWRKDRPNAGGSGVLLGAVLGLTAVSAALSVLLAPGPVTYYGTHTRAYQLLAGAALAIAARRYLARAPGSDDGSTRLRAGGAVLGVAALATLGTLAVEIPDSQNYPGLAGLAVTAAGVALIAALDLMGRHPLRRLAGARLPAAIGRLSYSLYLWHWPTIVFLPLFAKRHHIAWLGHKPAVVVAMTAFALLSYRLWERPIRFRVWRRAPERRVVLAGLATSAALAVTTVFALQAQTPFAAHALAAVTDLAQPGSCPYFARDWGDPAGAHACLLRKGSPHRLTVALVGDSHAQQWQPALLVLAQRYDLTIIRATRAGCAANDVTVDRASDPLGTTGTGEDCTKWRHRVYPDVVARYRPDLIFVATRSHVSAVLDGGKRVAPFTDAHRRLWSDGWDWTLRTLGSGGAHIVVSEILPTLPQRVPACLAAAGHPTTTCDFPVSGDRQVGAYNAIVRGLAQRAPHVSIFDPTPIGCPGGVCRAMSGNIVVHRDDNHLSAAYVRSRADQFEAAMAKAGAPLSAHRPGS